MRVMVHCLLSLRVQVPNKHILSQIVTYITAFRNLSTWLLGPLDPCIMGNAGFISSTRGPAMEFLFFGFVESLQSSVPSSSIRAWGSGFRVWDLGFRVWGLGLFGV